MEEEEYAWLPAEFLKPFRPGDTSGNPGGSASTDATLQACVEAATKAVLDREKQESGDGSLEVNGYKTDSDGGSSSCLLVETQNKFLASLLCWLTDVSLGFRKST